MDGNARGWYLAGYGVIIFFTLSGFLITFLLLKEKENSDINIKNFYIRRILRIWPLYYLYFALCLLTYFIFDIPFQKTGLLFYFFLSANIAPLFKLTLPYLYQYWSLGVEEQFYLFFPQLAKRSNKKLLNLCLVLIIALVGLKFIFWFLDRKFEYHAPLNIINVFGFQMMLIGVIGAILFHSVNQKFINFATHKITQIVAWGFIFFIIINRYHIISIIDSEIISIVAICLIVGQITRRNNIINLENKLCNFLGKISYSIYVIHPLIIFYYSRIIGHFKSDNILNYFIVYFLVTITTILLAYISHEFYEKRFLRLKAKYTTIKSTASGKDVDLPIEHK